MQAITSIMQSGLFSELVGSMDKGMCDGSLDLSKLLEVVQGMVSTINVQKSSENNDNSTIRMINSMINNLSPTTETIQIEEIKQ